MNTTLNVKHGLDSVLSRGIIILLLKYIILGCKLFTTWLRAILCLILSCCQCCSSIFQYFRRGVVSQMVVLVQGAHGPLRSYQCHEESCLWKGGFLLSCFHTLHLEWLSGFFSLRFLLLLERLPLFFDYVIILWMYCHGSQNFSKIDF